MKYRAICDTCGKTIYTRPSIFRSKVVVAQVVGTCRECSRKEYQEYIAKQMEDKIING